MRKFYLVCLITVVIFAVGCPQERKEPIKEMDPNTARILLTLAANPGSYLLLVFPPANIMIWSDMYHSEYHRYPESKEQLKAFVDTQSGYGLPILWDSIEELSFGPPDSETLTMNGTLIYKNNDGRISRVPFSFPMQSVDPNNISPEKKLLMEKELNKILLK